MALDQANIAYVGAISGTVDLKSTSVTEFKIGSSRLANRKWLVIQNKPTTKIYICAQLTLGTDPTNAVNCAKAGIKIAAGATITLPVSDKVPVFGIAHTGAGKRCAVMELA